MKRPFVIFISALLSSCLCACNLAGAVTPGGTNPGMVATEVILTLAVFTQSAQAPISSPTLEQQSSPTLGQPTSTQAIALSPTLTSTIGPTVTITLTPVFTNTPVPKPGALVGAISGYPYGSEPALVVVAYKQDSSTYWYVITSAGATSFSMTDSSNIGFVAPGSYQVVAYDGSGNSGGCAAMVTVISEQTVTCDITNWGGGYLAKPSGVPNP